MVRKFVDIEEAAKMIGISAETLNEMRDRREIYAYRDGGSWKFKLEDVERFVADRAAHTDQGAAEFAELDENVDSILLSEVELGESGPSTSSTVIGKSNEAPSPESDIELARPRPDDASAATQMSDVRLASDSDVLTSGSGTKFEELDALDLDLPSPAESGISLGSDSLALGGDVSIDDADLGLGDETRTKPPSSVKGSSAIELAGGDDDDDLVLGGSSGSDITHAAGDSGISLVDPADSGLALDEAPLELVGSSVESLELGGEDDMILLEEEADPEGATLLRADDDFLLTPTEEGAGEDSESGSQVIALDEPEFEEASPFASAPASSGVGMLEEDFGAMPGGALAPRVGAPAGAVLAAPGMAATAQVAEAPYSVANVLSLGLCLLFLLICGMMMFDLMRNMWSWNGELRVNSSLMDLIVNLFPS